MEDSSSKICKKELTKENIDLIGQLFNACDTDESGYIEQNEFASICSELSQDELNDVFKQLDQDSDGRISVTEFAEGFKSISQKIQTISRNRRRISSLTTLSRFGSRDSLDAAEKDDCAENDQLQALADGLSGLTGQEQVIELYQQIHSEYPQLIPAFERIILDVIRDVRCHQLENERLEQSFKREKEQHEKHLRQLEEEMESLMQKTEARVKKEERDKLELEKNEIRQSYDLEINELQMNLKRLQQMEVGIGPREASEEALALMKERLDEMTLENRHLKSQLTDAQTSQAISRSELASVRQQYEEKCRDLRREKNTLLDFIKEQDNLTRQLHLLHDANKKLHDTNDDLRAALETSRTRKPLPHRLNPDDDRGSVIGSYMDSTDGRARSLVSPSLSTDGLVSDPSYSRRRDRLSRNRSCDRDSLPDDFEDFDSGLSTLRDTNELDSEISSLDGDSHYDRVGRTRYGNEFTYTETETEVPESHDEFETEIEMDHSSSRTPSRPLSACSRSSLRSMKSRNTRRQLPSLPTKQEPIPKPIQKEPERMYKVVLCGDAAVGKSSFIMRLCKGKFVNNLNSTLGVDFQTKTVEVDERIIALQLWDTAGQERFRSIAKSYFRRADGVLLLYDCSYEKSFINVREWVDAIEDGAQKKLPIMLVGNKVDLREKMEREGRRVVRYDDGSRLARSYDALFIETSAKEGDNILECVTQLARMLRANEDIEVQSAGLQLADVDKGKNKPMTSQCCNL